MYTRGPALRNLQTVAERFPVTFHAITCNVGSTDPLDLDYLRQLKALMDLIRPVYLSDHLCWIGVAGENVHEILPMPFTEEALSHTAERVKRIQDILGRPLFLENSSGYLAYRMSTMSEVEFLVRLAEMADCGILLDVNNLYQGAFNQEFDAQAYIDAVPVDRIGYHHVAGHANKGKYLIDTHDEPVIGPVWDLYAQCEKRTGGRTTLLEWDAKLPAYKDLEAALEPARALRVCA